MLVAQIVPQHAVAQVPIPTASEVTAAADSLRQAGVTVNTAAPCCKPSIWDWLGCAQVHEFLQGVCTFLSNIPLLAGINDALLTPLLQAAGLVPPSQAAAFAGADAAAAGGAAAGGPPPPPSAGAAAAKIAADQEAAAEKIEAIRFLAQQDCNCYPEIVEALLAELDNCVEEVRYEALKALYGSCKKAICPHEGEPKSFVSRLFRHHDDMFCGSGSCPTCACQRQIIVRVSNLLIDRNPTGTYKEQSQRIRRLALALLKKCMLRVPPREEGGRGLEPEPDPYLGPAPDPGAPGDVLPPAPQTNRMRKDGAVIRGQSADVETSTPPRTFNATASLQEARMTGGLPTVFERAQPVWRNVNVPEHRRSTIDSTVVPSSTATTVSTSVSTSSVAVPEPASPKGGRPVFFRMPGDAEKAVTLTPQDWTASVPLFTRAALDLPLVSPAATNRVQPDEIDREATAASPRASSLAAGTQRVPAAMPASDAVQILSDDLFDWNGRAAREPHSDEKRSTRDEAWKPLAPKAPANPPEKPPARPALIPIVQQNGAPREVPMPTSELRPLPIPVPLKTPPTAPGEIQQTSFLEAEFAPQPRPLPLEASPQLVGAAAAPPRSEAISPPLPWERDTAAPQLRPADTIRESSSTKLSPVSISATNQSPTLAVLREVAAKPIPVVAAEASPLPELPPLVLESAATAIPEISTSQTEPSRTDDAPIDVPKSTPIAEFALQEPAVASEPIPVAALPPIPAPELRRPAVAVGDDVDDNGLTVVRQAVAERDVTAGIDVREPIELLSAALQEPPVPGTGAEPSAEDYGAYFGPNAEPIPGLVTVEEDEFLRAMRALETEALLGKRGYVNVGTERAEIAMFEIDSAKPLNNFKLRYNNYDNWSRPDRSEYLWAELTGKGPDVVQDDINFWELRAYNEAGSDTVTAFFEVPYRVVNLIDDDNTSGLGDLMIGAKTLLKESDRYKVTTIFKTYINTGSPRRGLGNGHIALEPGVLANYRLSCNTWAHSEFKINFPLAATPEFAGTVFKYGVGISTVCYAKPLHSGKCDKFALLTTFELNGWNFHDGLETDPILGPVSASGTSVVAAMLGLRFVFEDKYELGIGTSRALTDDRMFDSMFRTELRWLY